MKKAKNMDQVISKEYIDWLLDQYDLAQDAEEMRLIRGNLRFAIGVLHSVNEMEFTREDEVNYMIKLGEQEAKARIRLKLE